MSEESEVKIVRFLSGESVLAEVTKTETEFGGEGFKLTNPVAVQLMAPKTSGGNPDLAIAPFLPYADQDFIVVAKEMVLFSFVPLSEIVEKHKALHSKIITPTQGGIVTPK